MFSKKNIELFESLNYKYIIAAKLKSLPDELLNVQASIYIHKKTKDRYRLPGHFSNDARKIYKAFNLERSLLASIYQI